MADHFEYNKAFEDVNLFYKRLIEQMYRVIQSFGDALENGEFPVGWQIRSIKEPGVKGYVARRQVRLGGDSMLAPKYIPEERRQPLYDVFDEEENIKIYIELPGIDKEDIKLNVTDRFVEVTVKNFARTFDLPTVNVDLEKASASYKNGVLQVTIPKIQKNVEDMEKRTIRIE